MSSMLTPHAAAELLGVSESTVRRWCDSGLVEVAKTTGGHRRIDRQVLIAFARDQGLPLVDTSAMTTAGRGGRLASSAELAERLYSLVIVGDEVAAREFAYELVNRTGKLVPLCDDLIAPVMRRIGEEWACGKLRIFREHAATQAIVAALAGARAALAAASPDAPTAVCAGLTGDPYLLGPAMCSLILHGTGYRTMLLGPDAPVDDIVDAAQEVHATMIAVSVSAPPTDANDLVALCAAAAARRIPIALGGRQLTPALRCQIEPDFFGDTMGHLASYARRLRATAFSPHPSPAASPERRAPREDFPRSASACTGTSGRSPASFMEVEAALASSVHASPTQGAIGSSTNWSTPEDEGGGRGALLPGKGKLQ